MDGTPRSRAALERAIVRYAGNDAVLANDLAVALANAIVAQMVGAGVVKGGTSLKFRYGASFSGTGGSSPGRQLW